MGRSMLNGISQQILSHHFGRSLFLVGWIATNLNTTWMKIMNVFLDGIPLVNCLFKIMFLELTIILLLPWREFFIEKNIKKHLYYCDLQGGVIQPQGSDSIQKHLDLDFICRMSGSPLPGSHILQERHFLLKFALATPAPHLFGRWNPWLWPCWETPADHLHSAELKHVQTWNRLELAYLHLIPHMQRILQYLKHSTSIPAKTLALMGINAS